GDVNRLHCIFGVQFSDRADLDPVHVRNAGDDICAHLAGSDQADPDRLAGVGPLLEITRQSDRGNVTAHLKSSARHAAVLIITIEHLYRNQVGCSEFDQRMLSWACRFKPRGLKQRGRSGDTHPAFWEKLAEQGHFEGFYFLEHPLESEGRSVMTQKLQPAAWDISGERDD